jgi:hypothetical protein
MADEDETNHVPGSVLADAKGLVQQSLPARTRRSPLWAAAALVVLTLSVITMLGIPPVRNPGSPSPEAQYKPTLPRQLRSLDRSALKPRIISPVDGASIGAGELEIQWTGVNGSLHYDIQLVNAEGFIVHRDRVEGVTGWKPAAKHLLEAGKPYYVRVDAYLAEANSVSSDYILFTVEEPRQ